MLIGQKFPSSEDTRPAADERKHQFQFIFQYQWISARSMALVSMFLCNQSYASHGRDFLLGATILNFNGNGPIVPNTKKINSTAARNPSKDNHSTSHHHDFFQGPLVCYHLVDRNSNWFIDLLEKSKIKLAPTTSSTPSFSGKL